jgi:uncharacterized protein (TIGR02145 family)
MKKIYLIALTLLSAAAYGQIQHDVNKNGGTTESNTINDIDSIRFNSGSTEMEIVLDNGNIETHTLLDIDNVTFSGAVNDDYPSGYVHCGTPTEVIEVTNPITGDVWMDRNLGASQAATNFDDSDAYGDLFQWGRFADGHQCRTSNTTTTLSTTDTPGHGDFIIGSGLPFDWRNPQNDNLWDGVSGTNNPCPNDYRLPTEAELDAERQTWATNDRFGAFGSPLKFPSAGARDDSNGSLIVVGSEGLYWTSDVSGTNSRLMRLTSTDALITTFRRARGYSVRCIKDAGSQTTGSINTLDCGNANIIGTLEEGTAASGVSIDIDYTGGNGGAYSGQSISSTGVTGLTAQLSGGNFANGAGTLTFAISGTPATAGTATFPITIGGETCNLEVTVDAAGSIGDFPPGYVHCGTPTMVVDVTNPNTGETWMDRNLGASQVATNSNDVNSYGDLYQWGRFADGHQCRTSNTTATLSSTDNPGHGDFITINSSPYDWRSPQNDNLWQGVNGTNNPCPTGYRLPTEAELDAERLSWSSNDLSGAFGSPLSFPSAGLRNYGNGSVYVLTEGFYWTSNVGVNFSRRFDIDNSSASFTGSGRAYAASVRCIKD